MIKESTNELNELNYKTVKFEIDNEDGQLFSVLSELYSRPIDSCIREICTNCIDAHIMSGNINRPFVIKLPNYEEKINELSIRDFGPGLKHEQIMDIYRVYGKSTKTKNNNVTGCLGLGSKSPYAVSSVFYVRSYLNGKIYLYTCSMDNNNIPGISETPIVMDTDEENGLEVIIPIHKEVNFIAILKKELKHFKVKPLVYRKMGEVQEDEKVGIEWTQIRGRKFLTENISIDARLNNLATFFDCATGGKKPDNLSNAEIVQLQIYYPIDRDMIMASIDRFNKLYFDLEQNKVIEHFKISDFRKKTIEFLIKAGASLNSVPGKIAFSPSRETVKYTEQTLIYIIFEFNKAAKIFEKQLFTVFKNINCSDDYFDKFIKDDSKVELLKKAYALNHNDFKDLITSSSYIEYSKYFSEASIPGTYGYFNRGHLNGKNSINSCIKGSMKSANNLGFSELKALSMMSKIYPIDMFHVNRLSTLQNYSGHMTNVLYVEFFDIHQDLLNSILNIIREYKNSISLRLYNIYKTSILQVHEFYESGKIKFVDLNKFLTLMCPNIMYTDGYYGKEDVLPSAREIIDYEEFKNLHVNEIFNATKKINWLGMNEILLFRTFKSELCNLRDLNAYIYVADETFRFSTKSSNYEEILYFCNGMNKISGNYHKKLSDDYVGPSDFMENINIKSFHSESLIFSTSNSAKDILKLNKYKSGAQFIISEILFCLIHDHKSDLEKQFQIMKMNKFGVYKDRIKQSKIPTKYLNIKEVKYIKSSTSSSRTRVQFKESGNKPITISNYIMKWGDEYHDYINYLSDFAKLIYRDIVLSLLNQEFYLKCRILAENETFKLVEKLSQINIERVVREFKLLNDDFTIKNYNNHIGFIHRYKGAMEPKFCSLYMKNKYNELIESTTGNAIKFIYEEEDEESGQTERLTKYLYKFYGNETDPHFYNGKDRNCGMKPIETASVKVTINEWYLNYENLKEHGFTPVEWSGVFVNPLAKDYGNMMVLPDDDEELTYQRSIKAFGNGLGKLLNSTYSQHNDNYLINFLNMYSDNKNYVFYTYPTGINLTKDLKKERINATVLLLETMHKVQISVYDYSYVGEKYNINMLIPFASFDEHEFNKLKLGKFVKEMIKKHKLNFNIEFAEDMENIRIYEYCLYHYYTGEDLYHMLSNYVDLCYTFVGEKLKEKIVGNLSLFLEQYRDYIDINLKISGIEFPDVYSDKRLRDYSGGFEKIQKIFEICHKYMANGSSYMNLKKVKLDCKNTSIFLKRRLPYWERPDLDELEFVLSCSRNYEKYGTIESTKRADNEIKKIYDLIKNKDYNRLKHNLLSKGINKTINLRTIKHFKKNPEKYPKNYRIKMDKGSK